MRRHRVPSSTQTYQDTLDQLVDMYSKAVTATYYRAQHDLPGALLLPMTMWIG